MQMGNCGARGAIRQPADDEPWKDARRLALRVNIQTVPTGARLVAAKVLA